MNNNYKTNHVLRNNYRKFDSEMKTADIIKKTLDERNDFFMNHDHNFIDYIKEKLLSIFK